MLAHQLRSLLVAELLIYGAVGFGLYARGVWPLWAILLSLVVVTLLIRVAITFFLFVVSRRHASRGKPTTSLSAAQWVRLFLAEWAALTRLYLWLQVFPTHRQLDTPLPVVARPPVLMIHGYGCNEGFWSPLCRHLDQRGVYVVQTLNLEPVFGDLDAYVDQMNHAIEALCQRTQTRTLRIVAHSMGGLVARRYLHRYGFNRVERLVILGSPHQGTALARWGPGRNARQMEPDSAWLQSLNRVNVPVDTFNLYSTHDTIVAPQGSALLTEAMHVRNHSLGPVGHLEMAFNRRVHACVDEALIAPI